MNCIDVFNGDADGICALQQLRLHQPQPAAQLVTGVKRNVTLLARLTGTADSRLTVLDISLDRNRLELEQLLANGNFVFYADHHYSGDIPVSTFLETHIDPSPQLCTSLIIDRLLNGKFRAWAIVGAFGDNLDEVAGEFAKTIDLGEEELQTLRNIGLLLNYNAYGFSVDDLIVHPADLFHEVRQYPDPFNFYRNSAILRRLQSGYDCDMNNASKLYPLRTYSTGRIFKLPDAPWSKRVVGVFSNKVAREQPDMAHATLIANPDGHTLTVSVRAPLRNRTGADTLCRQFNTGGGRAAAAGINKLPADELGDFFSLFSRHFSC